MHPIINDKEESCVGLIEASVKKDLEVLYFGLVIVTGKVQVTPSSRK